MIAPTQPTKDVPRSPLIRCAHRLVASTLLSPRSTPDDRAEPVAAWRAWVFAAWVVIVVAVYGAYMVGWF